MSDDAVPGTGCLMNDDAVHRTKRGHPARAPEASAESNNNSQAALACACVRVCVWGGPCVYMHVYVCGGGPCV